MLTLAPFFRFCQFYIVKENRGNEGTCVGVSRWPVHDFNHRTTSDMWLYRAYSGNLYHNGEQTLTLSSFTQGDFITCVLDMEARTISFGKNGEVRGREGERGRKGTGERDETETQPSSAALSGVENKSLNY